MGYYLGFHLKLTHASTVDDYNILPQIYLVTIHFKIYVYQDMVFYSCLFLRTCRYLTKFFEGTTVQKTLSTRRVCETSLGPSKRWESYSPKRPMQEDDGGRRISTMLGDFSKTIWNPTCAYCICTPASPSPLRWPPLNQFKLSYLQRIPYGVVPIAVGYTDRILGHHLPPQELIDAVLPWVEVELEKIKSHNRAMVDLDDREGFLETMVWLKVVFLRNNSGCAIPRIAYSYSPGFQTPTVEQVCGGGPSSCCKPQGTTFQINCLINYWVKHYTHWCLIQYMILANIIPRDVHL